MAKELHELNELEERVILVAVEMDERSSRSAMDTDACLDAPIPVSRERRYFSCASST